MKGRPSAYLLSFPHSQTPMKPIYMTLAISVTGLIIYLSSVPGLTIIGNNSTVDQVVSNLAHIPAYALLTYLWIMTFCPGKFFKNEVIAYLILIGLVLFSISDEIHQSFVPGRTASAIDVGLDLLGISAGYLYFKLTRKAY